MKKSIPIAIVVVLLAASGALAQSKGGTSSPATPSGASSGSVPNAPVGHRQPRASDVPSAQEKSYTESAEDRALDRKIKSICRGC